MKRSHLLVMAGGLLAAVAFFQPFIQASSAAGVFGPGWSLQNLLRDDGLDYAFSLLCEPFAALVLLLFGWRARNMGRTTSAWSLSGAVVGLAFLLLYFTSAYALDHASGVNVGVEVQLMGSGYWLAAMGCGLGLIGALLGWRNRPARVAPDAQQEPEPSARRGKRLRPALLVVGGGLALVAGFFIPPFFTLPVESGSLFDRIQQPDGALLIWPEPLAALLVLAFGVLALSGWQGAYLGSLIGVLISLPFLVENVPAPWEGARPFYDYLGTGYWPAAIGCVLGLAGALLGVLERPAAPIAVRPLKPLHQQERPARKEQRMLRNATKRK
jgi:hypothetical protein